MKKYIFLLIVSTIIFSCGAGKAIVVKKKNNYIVDKYSKILQSPKSDVKNIELYTFVDDWCGTRYKYGGVSKSGIDCSGFCNVLYSQVYNKEIERTTSQLSKGTNRTSKSNLKEGDLVFFNISKKKNSHVGVYLKNNRFVHASSSKGVIISSLENPYYKKTYSKGGRLK